MATKALFRLVAITRIKIRVVHAENQSVLGDSGIIDQDVDPAKPFGGRFHRGGEGLGVGDIADDRLGRAAGGDGFGADLLELFQIPGDGDDVQARLRRGGGQWPRRSLGIHR